MLVDPEVDIPCGSLSLTGWLSLQLVVPDAGVPCSWLSLRLLVLEVGVPCGSLSLMLIVPGAHCP